MAYRTPNSSPSGSQSPSEEASPSTQPTSLNPAAMMPASEGSGSPKSRSVRATPSRVAVDLPRQQTASKGGCWTCRLRRKKCDEQRENDSCRTCIRLKIKCLGWGPKRPEWMRDKQTVDAYKAEIKAQLTRAGLIRGQPRPPPMQPGASGPVVPSQSRPGPYRPQVTADPGPSTSTQDIPTSSSNLDFYPYVGHNTRHPMDRHSMVPGVAGGSNSIFDTQLNAGPYTDPSYSVLDPNASSFFSNYPSHSTTPSSASAPPLSNTSDLSFDFTNLPGLTEPSEFNFGFRIPSPAPNFPPVSGGQGSTVQGHEQGQNYALHYFAHVRRIQYIFASNTVTNTIYSIIVQEPHGAVSSAVCALASLHSDRMRVAQGLVVPNANSEHSPTKYYHDEAFLHIMDAKRLHGRYNDNDALAALLLVSFSLFSGGITNWQQVLGVALEWVAQSGLPAEENPKLTVMNMNPNQQLIVKLAMWFDIFSSLSLMQPPKYISLYKRLLSETSVYWGGNMQAANELDAAQGNLRMETLTGCPNEVLLAIGEISDLAQWKSTEQGSGSLSVRELVRRGDDIEQRIRQHRTEIQSYSDVNHTPLHPSLSLDDSSQSASLFLTHEMRTSVASIFRETAILYLHTVLSGPNPGVSEIATSVGNVVSLLHQLPPSEVDRSLVFPICLAGCMTDSSPQRDFLKNRLQCQEESFGNVMQTRLLMEDVWRDRDVHGRAVDWRGIIQNQRNLLLV